MTTTTTPRSTETERRPRGELLVAGTVAVIGLVVLWRTAVMDVPGTGAFLGPQFFPYVVGALLLVLSALLVLQHVRGSAPSASTVAAGAERSDDDTSDSDASDTDGSDSDGSDSDASDTDTPGPIDWKPFGLVVLTLAAHVALLEPLGWLIAGAGLFFGVSYALGGRHVLRDLGVAFVMSSIAQLAFSAGLGMSLPAGILGAVV